MQTTTTQAIETATTVSTKAFVRELEWINRFIEAHTTIPILSNVAIIAAAGSVRLMATDLEIAGISDIDASDDSFFSITVPARQALKYLKKVQDAEIALSCEYREIPESTDKDGAVVPAYRVAERLTIRHGEDSEVELFGMSMDSYPTLPDPTASMTLSGLLTAIPRTITAICNEVSRFTLNGALLEVRGTDARLVSTDGHRLSLHEIQASSSGPVKTLLPKAALVELAHLKEDSLEFGREDNFVVFVAGRRRIISRVLEGNFPDYERVMPNCANVATVAAEPLRKAIDRVSVFIDERSHAMLFTLGVDKLTVHGATI